jgi:hypothetical protein
MVVINLPRRYVIHCETIDGRDSEYSVVSWLGRDKAVAWAALVHDSQTPERKIFRVSVEDAGEPTLDLDGYRLEPDEYIWTEWNGKEQPGRGDDASAVGSGYATRRTRTTAP